MLDKATVVKLVKQYTQLITNEFSPSAIVLFGSYVNGNPHEDSDIDVGIIFNNFSGDWQQTVTQLWRLRRDISLDIEPHLFDELNDKSGFVEHIKKTGEIVYQAA
jgi:predicted nucleotidyltransferase